MDSIAFSNVLSSRREGGIRYIFNWSLGVPLALPLKMILTFVASISIPKTFLAIFLSTPLSFSTASKILLLAALSKASSNADKSPFILFSASTSLIIFPYSKSDNASVMSLTVEDVDRMSLQRSLFNFPTGTKCLTASFAFILAFAALSRVLILEISIFSTIAKSTCLISPTENLTRFLMVFA